MRGSLAVVLTGVLATFQRGAVPDEPDDDKNEKEAEYVAEHDDNEPDPIVLLLMARLNYRVNRGRGMRR